MTQTDLWGKKVEPTGKAIVKTVDSQPTMKETVAGDIPSDAQPEDWLKWSMRQGFITRDLGNRINNLETWKADFLHRYEGDMAQVVNLLTQLAGQNQQKEQ